MPPGMPAHQCKTKYKACPGTACGCQIGTQGPQPGCCNRQHQHAYQGQHINHQRTAQDNLIRNTDTHLIIHRASTHRLRCPQYAHVIASSVGYPVEKAMAAALLGRAAAASALADRLHPDTVSFHRHYPPRFDQHLTAARRPSRPPFSRY